MKVDLDKFYTPYDVAKKCINEIDDLKEYDLIVEPSAGNGSFSKQLKCLAFDIEPESEEIKKQNFFEIKKLKGEHILFIGNPPFGKRSYLAKKFIEHSIKLNAETIAFILPNIFNKFLMQKIFPKNWKLKKIIPLDCDYLANGIKYFIPSSFFIWTTKETENIRKTEPKKNSDFIFLKREDKNADFCLNGNSGKIKELKNIKNSKSEHYIKVLDSLKIENVKETLSKIKWDFYSSVNGKNAWIGQKEIEEKYVEYCERKEN